MPDNIDENINNAQADAPAETAPEPQSKKQKPPKYSGAYWYLDLPDDTIKNISFTRSLLSVIALMLQFVAILLFPQAWADANIGLVAKVPSYLYMYVMVLFLTIIVAIYTIIVNFTRNKLVKRIPYERAKRGFKIFTFWSTEILLLLLFVLFVMYLSFVCLQYDGYGLTCMFMSALSLGAQTYGRIAAHKALRRAELIKAPEKN